ncbi:ribbon-helix-helix protein, CopG family [Sulfurisphaera ohwakuensis]|uniref:ribbon-helix-helix protein, CopG family n=1 Tax=Sulfurisphaera ohwakuensis TaxID=69656 RepID=UPI0036F32B9B
MKAKVESVGKLFYWNHRPSDPAINVHIKINNGEGEIGISYGMRMVSVRLPYEMYKKLEAYAKARGKTQSDVIREALEHYLG